MDAKEVLNKKKPLNPQTNPLKVALDPNTNEPKRKGRPRIYNNLDQIKDTKYIKN